jgi:hypothetical protein
LEIPIFQHADYEGGSGTLYHYVCQRLYARKEIQEVVPTHYYCYGIPSVISAYVDNAIHAFPTIKQARFFFY